MLTQEEQADLDFINEMATTNPSNLTDDDWDLAGKLEKKAKEATGRKSPEEIKARGEEAYKQMMGEIETERERQDVTDRYGWITDNSVPNVAMSILSPSSMESIHSGKMPSVADISIDAALNAAGILATPERIATTAGRAAPRVGRMLAPTASRLKNIVVGAAEQGAISGAGEGILSTKHDRDYSMTAPLIGTVAGGAIGGTATTSMAKKLLDAGYKPDEIANLVTKLGTTEAGSLKSFGDVADLKQIGSSKISIPSMLDDELLPPKLWDSYTAYKQAGNDVVVPPIKKAMNDVINTPNISLKEKERTLKELQELEDTYYKKLIASDEANMKFADRLLGGDNSKYARDLGVNVDALTEMIKKPSTTIPLAGYLKDVDETITNPTLRRSLIVDIADKSGESQALKGLLNRGKYEEILQKTPDIIRSGTVLETAKNVLESAPHSIKTARTVMQAPVAITERVQKRKELPAETLPKYVNRSGYNSDGDLLYAPRGYITWDDLWADAPKK